jgi:hypothetical protein
VDRANVDKREVTAEGSAIKCNPKYPVDYLLLPNSRVQAIKYLLVTSERLEKAERTRRKGVIERLVERLFG